jgi:hypothetical protein
MLIFELKCGLKIDFYEKNGRYTEGSFFALPLRH